MTWVEKRKEFSRRLRRDQTDAERKLWVLLRSRHFIGFKFRRQRAIGPYIVDFICFETKLVIELDGGQHSDKRNYDEKRTAYLEEHGFQVIRFWDNEVLKNMEGVLQEIEKCLNGPPSPALRAASPTLLGERMKHGGGAQS